MLSPTSEVKTESWSENRIASHFPLTMCDGFISGLLALAVSVVKAAE